VEEFSTVKQLNTPQVLERIENWNWVIFVKEVVKSQINQIRSVKMTHSLKYELD
jgi:hypothetical protein